MTAPAVVLSGVSVRYGRAQALRGLSLTVPRGRILGLVGSNGAGKTTALCALVGLLRPCAGEIDLLGEGGFDPACHAGRVSLLPQDAQLPPHARLDELLSYYGRLQGLPAAGLAARVEALLAKVHLADRARHRVRTLSHGMAQRVAIAQAFLGDPELVLLDEPLNGLDPYEVKRMRDFLLAKRPEQTLIISSHLLDEVEAVCDDVAFIDQGRLTQQAGLAVLTRRDQAVRIRFEGEVSLPGILRALEGRNVDARVAGEELLLSADDERMTVGELNALVLPVLLAQGVRILEVSRGHTLADQYLATLNGPAL